MYWLILLIPLLVAWGAKFYFHTTITWKEMAIQIAVSLAIVSVVLSTGLFSQTTDIEVWNGEVVDKQRVQVSCSHSYDCYCVTVSCGDDCTTTICQTCYDHDYDVDWRVMSNIESYMNIQRKDRQGLKEPERWTQVKIGEPYSSEHVFTNYVKAVPESIFGYIDQNENAPTLVPAYPNVYDYYRITRVISNGVPLPDHKEWNDGLNEIAKKLGSRYKVNPIIQFIKTADPTYQFDLEKRWLNGKKNDIVIVFGVSTYPNIDFVRVVGWENEAIKKYLTDELSSAKIMNGEFRIFALESIDKNIQKHFKKMNMEDYAYLKDQIEPPLWVIILAFALAIGLSIGLTYFFHKNDW